MKKQKKDHGGCKDIFRAFLIENAKFSGMYDIPVIRAEHSVPRKLIRFSDACREKKDYNQWVMFYENDFEFERIWNQPRRYLRILSKFEGVITPDFSLYYDMPLAMQIWNIYRSRAIGSWLQHNGVRVIPNIRVGARDTMEVSCTGIPKHNIIAMGTLGCLDDLAYREKFEQNVEIITELLEPETIVVYGGLPSVFSRLKKRGISVVHSPADYSFFRKEEK